MLAEPPARTAERQAARAGQLAQAAIRFTPAARVPMAGLMAILATPAAEHLLGAFEGTYGQLADGFYGLGPTVLTLLFLALPGGPRAEGLTGHRSVDLGRLLGPGRAPEVRTLRRKLAELGARNKAGDLQGALAAAHAAGRPDLLGWPHVDGHTRAYFGRRDLPKTLISRTHMAGRASGETWIANTNADPLLVIPALPTASLAAELLRALPDLRALVARRPAGHRHLRPRWLVTGDVRQDDRRRFRHPDLPQGALPAGT